MNRFEIAKAAVTPRMAAEQYELSIKQGSMICRPFHDDWTPSMKLNAEAQVELEGRSFRVLGDYLQILRDWKTNCAPQSPEDDIDPRYAEVCHMLERIENMLDILIYGTPKERPRWWPTCRRATGRH